MTSAQVRWNPKDFSDPDDPNEARQIDVLIEESGRRTGVECRNRMGIQSVMWVEELIGRKQSLGLDSIIGVAVNGFTKLAQVKARRYGVILYDFKTLTDEEISSWANAATVDAKFLQFDPLIIVATIWKADEAKLPAETKFQYQNQDGFGAVMSAIRDDAAAHLGEVREQALNTTDFHLNSVPLVTLRARYAAQLVITSATTTAVTASGHPDESIALRDVTVQRFNHTVSEVIRKENNVHVVVDVSRLNPPPDSILHEMDIKFQQQVALKDYELVGTRMILSKGVNTELLVLAVQ